MELRFLHGKFEHGQFKLQFREPGGLMDWTDVPSVEEDAKTLRVRIREIYPLANQSTSKGIIDLCKEEAINCVIGKSNGHTYSKWIDFQFQVLDKIKERFQ